ncbi:MAG TPA: hypothetical protein PK156_32520, partial [Polyangium sp.]|nr:hypothetical protein [Polyangium sp.]
IDSFGKAMGPSLAEAGVIMPYSRAKIFTRGWEGKFQAHHLLEVEMAKDTMKMDAKAINDIPARKRRRLEEHLWPRTCPALPHELRKTWRHLTWQPCSTSPSA